MSYPGTGVSSTLRTTRNNSILISYVYPEAESTFTTVTAGAESTLNSSNYSSANYNLSTERSSAAISSAGTVATSSWTWNPTSTGGANFFEALAPLVPVSQVTSDQFDSVNTANSGGGAFDIMSINTAGPNELLILAITWKSASPLAELPTGGPGNWVSLGSVTHPPRATK